MKGEVLDFSLQNSTGIINAEDGNRYQFAASEWKEEGMPTKGMKVDFIVNSNGQAEGVYLLTQAKPVKTTKSLSFDTAKITKSAEEMNLFDHALACVTQKYAKFDGRAGRREFWGFALFQFLIQLGFFVLLFIMASISQDLGQLVDILSSLVALALFIPNIAVSARRLHDIGKSGWWTLLALIPLIGSIWLIALWAKEGEPSSNQYGDPV